MPHVCSLLSLAWTSMQGLRLQLGTTCTAAGRWATPATIPACRCMVNHTVRLQAHDVRRTSRCVTRVASRVSSVVLEPRTGLLACSQMWHGASPVQSYEAWWDAHASPDCYKDGLTC